MNREQLDTAPMEALQKEAIAAGIPFTPDRAALIETILSHRERHGSTANGGATSHGTEVEEDGAITEQLRQSVELLAETMKQQHRDMLLQQQQFMALVLERLSPAEGPVQNTGNVVQCLATQIPEFAGSREENVATCIRRVDHVGRIHGATDGVLLLAASSRFRSGVKNWYDSVEGEALESWHALKNELSLMFESNEFAYKQLQTAQGKKWQHAKELFHDYGIAKLALMNRLDLSTKEKIHLLIGGIGIGSVKSAALTLPDDSVSRFLVKMRCLAEGAVEIDKKPSAPASAQISKERHCRNCGKKGHSHKDCRAEPSCFYCKERGHRQFDCPVLKKKTSSNPAQPKHRALTAAAVEEETEEDDVVATINVTSGKRLELNGPCATVTSVNQLSCDLPALIDTGSPVSIMRFQIYKEFLLPGNVKLLPTGKRLRGITNDRLTVLGKTSAPITLETLGDKSFTVDFFVVDDSACLPSMLLGRDFVAGESLSLKYRTAKTDSANIIAELCQIEPEVTTETAESIIRETNIDYGENAKRELINTITRVQNEEVEPVEDDYAVRVPIKDDTVYAYAPRRFAYAERIELRKIVEDLLQRGIIQPSRSSYCARVIPIRKKNGLLRLCVDLRPLNSRISKQKYPFLVIEDCLARLFGKTVFTLLDLKDGFHQIRVCDEHTHYFAFATPDGQYEYRFLPFGYSEAPAEFQKRILQILEPFIKRDQILVYIDDILIALHVCPVSVVILNPLKIFTKSEVGSRSKRQDRGEKSLRISLRTTEKRKKFVTVRCVRYSRSVRNVLANEQGEEIREPLWFEQ
ncbi:uncharacterized protein K02A2.6-like [Solenopsis invicta]|uniref:uncharacterized protein K02A2.6-like n=1 Tax=Solenopsis invicta TaxID=13686 RepID=UPI00193E804F|nr:uncharacterized protein K02A2.6-like [Solenopsis invicta]